jgi:hypothetical protein
MTSSSSMTIITPKPSVIFSTTSSSSSIRSCCGDDDNGNVNVGEEGEFDGQEDEQIGLYVDDSAGNDDDDDDDDDDDEQKITTLFSSSTTTPSTTTTATSTTTDEAQIHKLTTIQTATRKKMTTLMMNISKRILQLFMIHFFVYISITVYYQSTNRLLIKDIIGSSGDGGLIASFILTSNTNTNSNTTLFNDINININNDNDNNSSTDHQDCYYVPGGGFSGYWFLLGRLQKMKRHQMNMNDKKFVCYSSGCLGVIATLLMNDNDNDNNNVDSIYNMARTIQMEWNEGRLHQYQVVESFIDGLLSPVLDNDNNKEQQQQQEEAFLETIRNNLYIITSTYDDNSNNSSTNMPSSIIPTAIIQQPTNIHELKQMLLQTAWIPFVTGSSWTYKNQMDGAFSTFQHPKCHTNIELIVPEIMPIQILPSILLTTTETETETGTKPSITIMQALKLWTNILNVNLKKNDVDILWKMGFDYGV